MVDLLPRLREIGTPAGSAQVQVELCVFNGERTAFYEQLEGMGIRIHALSQKPNVYNPLLIPKLRRLMRGFDIVHTHNTACQLFAAIAKGIGVKGEGTGRCPKLVTTEHNTDNRRRSKWYLKGGDRWMYSKYDRIICISDQAETNLTKYLPCLSDKAITIYNGIDVERFSDAVPVEEWKRDFAGRKVIAMVAAFRLQKDQKTLIDSFAYLPDDYVLLLVGGGETLADMKAYASGKEYGERVFFTGVRTDIPNVMKSADVLVLSTHYEGLSLSNVEGMASGVPFVASDVDGVREVTRGYGVLFPHGDSKALAEAVLRLTTDGEYRQEVVRRCQKRARQFDIQTMAEKYAREYGRLMGEG